jgi:acyl-CoA synthetase (AMP-forming)/AMP-acid ligase II/alkylation response protein AidB-like acyl-CoA dehydrogenase/acyl carrier protein
MKIAKSVPGESDMTATISAPRAAHPDDLVGVLRQRVQLHGDARACIYLGDGEAEKATLSFAELDLQARAVAARLQGLGVSGECALLLYPPGPEFLAAFFGCLYAGVVAVPLPVPHLRSGMTQFHGIVSDLSARVLLTTETTLARLERLDSPTLEGLMRICSEDTAPSLARAWQVPKTNPGDVAYLQYTSGSTSDRKGVAVSHANVIANLRAIAARFEHHAGSVCVNWLPHFHDLGLVGGILQPLYHGHLNVMMSPTAFVQRPIRWLDAISRYRGTYSHSPNYGYDLCVRRITPEQLSGLDLASWEVALNGAEPVRAATIEAFASTFGPCGFRRETMYPAYGLAEATLVVSGGRKDAAPIMIDVDAEALEHDRVVEVPGGHGMRRLVGCGRPLDDTSVRIVAPDTRRACADGEIGEIWVAGPAVARGYWQRLDDTRATFQARLDGTCVDGHLRTGDLGFLRGGELFITGRLKDLIIIRGANHYPQEIEWTVEQCHAAFRPGCCAAFATDVDGEERLVVAIEIERDHLRALAVDQVAATARRAIAEAHELQLDTLVLLRTGTIPRTSSGKIQRRRCRSDFLADALESVGVSRMRDGDARSTPPELTRATPTERTDRASELCAWLRRYADERLNSRLMDERRSLAPHVVLDLGNRGVLGLQVPQALGGQGLGHRDTLRVFEQIGAIDLTLAMMVIVHNTLGIGPILKHADPAIRATLLPRLASGRELVAFAITEPGAGSNPQAIAARAHADGAEAWILNGQKSWSGSAGWASVINVFVQNVDATGQARGLSGFVVPRDTPGLRIGPEALTFGMRAMVQNTIYLEDARVTRAHCLGEIGGGMAVAQDAMMQGRLAIAAACVGGIKRCLQLLMRYATRRTIATGPLIDNPVLLERIGSLGAAVATIEALVARIAERLDAGSDVPIDAYVVCKTTAPEWLWQAADTLMQFLGGRGYIDTNVAAQMLRDARVTRILEGPTEALEMYLGSRVVNERVSLERFIATDLGAPAVARRLVQVAEEIQLRAMSSSRPRFGDDASSRRWSYALIGHVASAATLLAVAGAQERAWAEQYFAQAVAAAHARTEADAFAIDARLAEAMVSGYAAAIGDVEQAQAGEDHALDDMLRRDAPAATANRRPTVSPPATTAATPELVTPEPVAAPAAAASTAAAPAAVTNTEIERFIVQWVAKEMKLPEGAIDPARSLLDYGLDSVTTVLLVASLEDWLQVELPPEVVYQFPVLRVLAAHVASQASTRVAAACRA